MAEYEEFTLVCAGYEGSYMETRSLWKRYMQGYGESLTENNAIVYAMRLWIGSGGYAGEHTAEAL